jgi:hypothetical protein
MELTYVDDVEFYDNTSSMLGRVREMRFYLGEMLRPQTRTKAVMHDNQAKMLAEMVSLIRDYNAFRLELVQDELSESPNMFLEPTTYEEVVQAMDVYVSGDLFDTQHLSTLRDAVFNYDGKRPVDPAIRALHNFVHDMKNLPEEADMLAMLVRQALSQRGDVTPFDVGGSSSSLAKLVKAVDRLVSKHGVPAVRRKAYRVGMKHAWNLKQMYPVSESIEQTMARMKL